MSYAYGGNKPPQYRAKDFKGYKCVMIAHTHNEPVGEPDYEPVNLGFDKWCGFAFCDKKGKHTHSCCPECGEWGCANKKCNVCKKIRRKYHSK